MLNFQTLLNYQFISKKMQFFSLRTFIDCQRPVTRIIVMSLPTFTVIRVRDVCSVCIESVRIESGYFYGCNQDKTSTVYIV